MDVVRTITPGKKGSIRFLKEWGDQLLNVRYRKDTQANEWLTTIEIVVDRRPIRPKDTQDRAYMAQRNREAVALRIGYLEKAIRQRIKQAGGRWSKQLGLWITLRENAIRLGLVDRIVEGAADQCTDIDTSFL